MFEISAVSSSASVVPDAVYTWGLSVIHAFQSPGNPMLTAIAHFFTMLGSPFVYILILPILFWCIDEKRGFRLILSAFISNGINAAIKDKLRVPRPFVRDPSVKLIEESGFSTPSGHSQNSATIWPMFLLDRNADGAPRSYFAVRLAASIALPLCIGLSRIYLGVHYPTDVLFGWFLGACVSVFFLVVYPVLHKLFTESKTGPLASIRETFRAAESAGRSMRTYKIALAAIAAFLLNAISPDSSSGGAVFGFAAGYILLTDKHADQREAESEENDERAANTVFSAASGSLIKKAARLITGLASLILIFIVLSKILPGKESPYYQLCLFIRFGFSGFWASFCAPKLFMKAKLV